MTSRFSKLTNPKEYEEFLRSTSSLLIFGYPKGTFVPLEVRDTSDQEILFKSGNVLNGIQIGHNAYGGMGGNPSGPYLWSTTGKFTLQSLWAGDNNISNLTFILGKQPPVTIGNGSHKEVELNVATASCPGLTVTFAGITYDTYINQLVFQVASK